MKRVTTIYVAYGLQEISLRLPSKNETIGELKCRIPSDEMVIYVRRSAL